MLQTRVLACTLLAATAATQVREPKFTTGDLADLDCRVVDARPVDGGWHTLRVEVVNRGTTAAEPLEFAIEIPTPKNAPPRRETFRRVGLPYLARFGRPAPPGGRQSYWLTTALPGKKGQFAVRVLGASWYDGGDLRDPGIRIGAPETVQRTSLAGTFPITQVALTNPFDREVDALVLVTLAQPIDGIELMGFRLPAKTTTAFTISTRPGPKCFLERDGAPGCPMKATGFQLVDWSLVGTPADDAGTTLLRPAYEAWYRWTDPAITITGRFAWQELRLQLNSTTQYDTFAAAGRFTAGADGTTRVEFESGNQAGAKEMLADMFAQLRRPDWAGFTAANPLVPIAGDRVAIRGRGLFDGGGTFLSAGTDPANQRFPDVQVEGSRITSSGFDDDPRDVWHTELHDAQWLLTRRQSPSAIWTCSHGMLAGLVVPLHSTFAQTLGRENPYSTQSIRLTDLRADGRDSVQPQLPTGEGAAALRAIWDAGYRVPEAPLAITARFAVTTGDGEDLWRGTKKFAGRLTATGFGRSLRDLHCAFDGKLAPDLQSLLTAGLYDRFVIWYLRDPNARASFDQVFAGAVIAAPDADGAFAVEHGPFTKVLTGDGLLRGWQRGPGLRATFHHQKFGATPAVTKVVIEHGTDKDKAAARWTETVLIKLVAVGEHLLPASLRFEQIYGKGWGPEVIELTDVAVK